MKKPAAVDLDADPSYAFAPEDTVNARRDGNPATGGAEASRTPVAEPPRQSSWLGRLNPFQEQHFARRVAREIVELRHRLEATRPGIGGIELLRLVVMVRCKLDPYGAQKLLDEADESFASWPTPRELVFADVVHLIAIKEFHAQFGKNKWINANMGQIVAAELQRLR